ncbi:hypothetical protein DIPPA_02843 [Diplonema papillatum]|nr:hypothetical protein DIPPA_02843 [Diplonema papillatum]
MNDVTVWEVEERCASLIEYRMILKDQMKKYKDHHDTDLNQKASLKELETRLRVDQAILFFDYSAKYISQIHEGPQQIAYGQQRMSMLVFIIRKLDPAYLPDKRVFRSHCVFYLSDDTKEDSFQAVQTLHTFFLEYGVVRNMWAGGLFSFSDGGSHFKNRFMLTALHLWRNSFNWTVNFWESSHGKGYWDAEGGRQKDVLRVESRSATFSDPKSACLAKQSQQSPERQEAPPLPLAAAAGPPPPLAPPQPTALAARLAAAQRVAAAAAAEVAACVAERGEQEKEKPDLLDKEKAEKEKAEKEKEKAAERARRSRQKRKGENEKKKKKNIDTVASAGVSTEEESQDCDSSSVRKKPRRSAEAPKRRRRSPSWEREAPHWETPAPAAPRWHAPRAPRAPAPPGPATPPHPAHHEVGLAIAAQAMSLCGDVASFAPRLSSLETTAAARLSSLEAKVAEFSVQLAGVRAAMEAVSEASVAVLEEVGGPQGGSEEELPKPKKGKRKK